MVTVRTPRDHHNLTVREAIDILESVPVEALEGRSVLREDLFKDDTYAMLVSACLTIREARQSESAYIGTVLSKAIIKEFGGNTDDD